MLSSASRLRYLFLYTEKSAPEAHLSKLRSVFGQFLSTRHSGSELRMVSLEAFGSLDCGETTIFTKWENKYNVEFCFTALLLVLIYREVCSRCTPFKVVEGFWPGSKYSSLRKRIKNGFSGSIWFFRLRGNNNIYEMGKQI
jgi:hypothetical protein